MGQYITFRVARQAFAMDATRIRGLLPLHDMQLLDQPQQWIVGIAAIRGRDFPVVDLRGKLGIRRRSNGRTPCIVAVEVAGPRLIGFVADRVSEVIALRTPGLASGTLRIAGRTRRILDPDKILSEEAAHAYCQPLIPSSASSMAFFASGVNPTSGSRGGPP